MTVLSAILLAVCISRCALAVYPPVFPTNALTSPVMTHGEAEHANRVLNAANLTVFRCPLAMRVTNMMVNLADGVTYNLHHVYASSWKKSTLTLECMWREYQVPDIFAYAIANVDLMKIIKDAGGLVNSIKQGRVPETIRPWVQTKKPLKPIWICKDGRSRFIWSFAHPTKVVNAGMVLILSGSNVGHCFRNLHLERVVDHICTIVDCSAANVTTTTMASASKRRPASAASIDPSSPADPHRVLAASRIFGSSRPATQGITAKRPIGTVSGDGAAPRSDKERRT